MADARIDAFFELRARWAGVHNLSGPRALQDPQTIDLLDAQALVGVLAPNLPLVDVGAGSGVPGLLVACIEPDRPVWLVEPLVKRMAFLRTAVHALGLAHVRLQRERWPVTIGQPVQVVSRAVVSPEEWPALAAAGGADVVAVLRFLAAKRPPFTVPGFVEAAGADYAVGDADRRVERWERMG